MPRRPRASAASAPDAAPAAPDAAVCGAVPAAPAPAVPGLDPAELDAPGIRRALLGWYDERGRPLPFRGTRDPWAILVSESMAQQTQAARAGEAWRSFMRLFPTPAALAAAAPSEVLRAWRGLGYNRRALALHAAAIAIVEEHDGRVPDDLDALLQLPGVGPYTARAVLALAYGRPVGAVDTNVRRVLERLVQRRPSGLAEPSTPVPPTAPPMPVPPAAPPGRLRPADIQALADALVDPLRPGDWTHGLMDVGARVCRASTVDCPACPLAPWCRTLAARGDAVAPGTHPTRRAAASVSRAAKETRAPFAATTRWLRGRLVDRLRDAPDGEWVRLDGPVGEHDAAAVAVAIAALERDGLLERHPADAALARLPTAAPRSIPR